MSVSLINDVGSIIVIGDEPGRTFPPVAGIITQNLKLVNEEIIRRFRGLRR
jgi:3-oxoacyl-[acyl-carrier-protein] synthase III